MDIGEVGSAVPQPDQPLGGVGFKDRASEQAQVEGKVFLSSSNPTTSIKSNAMQPVSPN